MAYRKMTTSSWLDLKELISSKEMMVTDQEGISLNDDIVHRMEVNSWSGALRWAVGIALTGKMELAAQFLPASAKVLSNNPTLNG
jgi:hypothetical protein